MLFSVPFNSYSISVRKEILYQNFSLIHFPWQSKENHDFGNNHFITNADIKCNSAIS